ncbi:UNVERIFIED_CONTAM: hypothetical protein GTU68_012892, partial [Idotea baltica]|nr:hypothetical protein [Idotea baltica]
MLLVKQIREDIDKVKARLLIRNWKEENLSILEEILSLDDQRKKLQTENDSNLSLVNKASKEIGMLMKNGEKDQAESKKQEVADLKATIKVSEDSMNEVNTKLTEALLSVPNLAHETVPTGNSDEDNEVIKDWSDELPKLPEGSLPHWELAKKYNLIDFELGVKITGAGFPLFRGKGARLERALINFFLDEAHAAGYEEIIPPLLVNEDSARGTGQIPDKEGQMYYVTKDDLYLIPTAEVPVTNIYRNVIVKEEEFPIKLTGYTPCFRREAGSYGADVKGLNRVHQFDKVEIVQIRKPEESYEVLDEMVKHVEGLLIKLGLPYRILRLCGGDLGFASALTYDFEVFSAAQEKWLEVSSVSNFETFQSNRLKCRYKDENGKKQLVHTLNGSALALARIIASLLENNQTENGITIPEVLIP